MSLKDLKVITRELANESINYMWDFYWGFFYYYYSWLNKGSNNKNNNKNWKPTEENFTVLYQLQHPKLSIKV